MLLTAVGEPHGRQSIPTTPNVKYHLGEGVAGQALALHVALNRELDRVLQARGRRIRGLTRCNIKGHIRGEDLR
jgi:hypothetical protein